MSTAEKQKELSFHSLNLHSRHACISEGKWFQLAWGGMPLDMMAILHTYTHTPLMTKMGLRGTIFSNLSCNFCRDVPVLKMDLTITVAYELNLKHHCGQLRPTFSSPFYKASSRQESYVFIPPHILYKISKCRTEGLLFCL